MCIKMPNLPTKCWDCKFFTDQWDYPTCLITTNSRGYNFNGQTQRMSDCPLPTDLSYESLYRFLQYFDAEP